MKLNPPTADGPLLAWLLVALAPMNRTRVKQLLQHGRVVVNGVPTTRFDHPLKAGDRVEVARDTAPRGETANAAERRAGRDKRPAPGKPTLPILHQDAAVVVIDKPAGLLTVATEAEKTDTAFVRLGEQLKSRVFVVHRLDRDTSGLLLFARSDAARDQLQAGWGAVEKSYLAVVEGTPRPAAGAVENFLLEGKNLRVRACRADAPGAKRAVSRYRVVGTKGGFSLVEVVIETGRKHQIRAHLAGLGCPVIGDADYGATTNPARRLGLHARRLAVPHPVTGERLEVESPLPPELGRVGPFS